MATGGWRTRRSVIDWLFSEGWRFDFFQAVKLLEMSRPWRRQVGETPRPAKEPVRFSSNVSFSFPASEVQEASRSSDDEPARLKVNFMGLAGALGPLPSPYTQLILDRSKRKDYSFRDFLDIFNHRLISIMYRARKKLRVGFEAKRPSRSVFAFYLFSLIGMGTPWLRAKEGRRTGRLGLEDGALLHYAGILATHPRSMKGLEIILSDYFAHPVRGEQFVGGWFDLDADQVTRLGLVESGQSTLPRQSAVPEQGTAQGEAAKSEPLAGSAAPEAPDRSEGFGRLTSSGLSGHNYILGESAVLGVRVWDQHAYFRLHIGPLSFERFVDFLPVGAAFAPLCRLTRFYAGPEFDFKVRVYLKAEDIQETRLGGECAMLGWTTWLTTRDRAEDAAVDLHPEVFIGEAF